MAFPLLHAPGPCPACHATDCFRPLHVYANDARQVNAAPSLALLGCERCGLVFSHPLPSDLELAAYYSKPGGWEARVREEEVEHKLALKRERYRGALALLAPYLEPRRAPKALDFGCGLGAWLDVLREAGWDTYGIEPGPTQSEVAGRRHRILQAVPSDASFDLVVVNHVLEHLRDPLSVLVSLAACTAPGGRLFVSVPDFGRLAEHRKWGYVKNERHICSYTFAAMRSMLGLAGFTSIHLDNADWDSLGSSERWHLKVLAEKTGTTVEPSGYPLAEAVNALLAYEEDADRLVRMQARRHRWPFRAAKRALLAYDRAADRLAQTRHRLHR